MNSSFALIECQDEALRAHLLSAQSRISVKYTEDKRGRYRNIWYSGDPYWIDTSKGERLLFSATDAECGYRTIGLREADKKKWNIIVKYSRPIRFDTSSPRLVFLINQEVARQWNNEEVEGVMYLG